MSTELLLTLLGSAMAFALAMTELLISELRERITQAEQRAATAEAKASAALRIVQPFLHDGGDDV